MESWTLLQLNQFIRQQIKGAVTDSYWVVAEINELYTNNSGHCYMELVEKAPRNGEIIAKIRASIWSYSFRMLAPYFQTTTGQPLSSGMKVMLRANVDFHEIYGLSLHVIDINPAFTLGDLAMQRQAIIQKLTGEGVIGMNKELVLPEVMQRIAVISSETAAGYGDFVNQLHNNPRGYAFRHTLFQAAMQGNGAENAILHALEQIYARENEFDAVVIIRGGGSQSDLNCFNSYLLASSIAQFPLPVITGIGHERDETIADMVARISLKTPTAVAEYIIQTATAIDRRLQELHKRLHQARTSCMQRNIDKLTQLRHRLHTALQRKIHTADRQLLTLDLRLKNAARMFRQQKRQELDQLNERLHAAKNKYIQSQKDLLQNMRQRIAHLAGNMLAREKNRIETMGNKVYLLDPARMLERGYSLTVANGKVIHSANELQHGQTVKTWLHEGYLESIVTATHQANRKSENENRDAANEQHHEI